MKKTYILDTNVLLHDATSLYRFQENDIILPITVIEELDTVKKEQSEIGRNARQVSRSIDQLRQKGRLVNGGVELPGGGRLKIRMSTSKYEKYIRSTINQCLRADHRILAVALEQHELLQESSQSCILISKDINLRILADGIGLTAEDYHSDKIQYESLHTGFSKETLLSSEIDQLYSTKFTDITKLGFNKLHFYPNQFVQIQASDDLAHTGLFQFVVKNNQHVLKAVKPITQAWGLQARNFEQKLALQLLFDPEIKLVTLVGKAGTGKTLLALAAGLEQTAELAKYSRVLVSRPVFPLGRDLGFLPGTVQEKLEPWMQPIYDNLDFLFTSNETSSRSRKKNTANTKINDFINFGILEIEALTYIRGRSIPNQYLIVDEAQNLTPHEVKTIITRAGEGTKIVLTGDPNQIDNPYVDSESNGLSYTIARLKSAAIAGHISLFSGERSELAAIAAELL